MTLEGGGGGGEGKVACEVKPPVPVKMSSTAHIPATVIKLFRFYVSTHSSRRNHSQASHNEAESLNECVSLDLTARL